MAGLGVYAIEDLALSVVVTVIGHRPEYGWIVTDGGWLAMSRDRGTAAQEQDQGYGLIADLDGHVIPDLVMTAASQGHGTLITRKGAPLPDLSVGTRLGVLPNHAWPPRHSTVDTTSSTAPRAPHRQRHSGDQRLLAAHLRMVTTVDRQGHAPRVSAGNPHSCAAGAGPRSAAPSPGPRRR
jgi:hypothetical protein